MVLTLCPLWKQTSVGQKAEGARDDVVEFSSVDSESCWGERSNGGCCRVRQFLSVRIPHCIPRGSESRFLAGRSDVFRCKDHPRMEAVVIVVTHRPLRGGKGSLMSGSCWRRVWPTHRRHTRRIGNGTMETEAVDRAVRLVHQVGNWEKFLQCARFMVTFLRRLVARTIAQQISKVVEEKSPQRASHHAGNHRQ